MYKFIVKKDETLALSPIVDYVGKLYEIDSYINLIKLNFFYPGDLEVSQTTKCYKINLAVYKYDNKDDNYKQIHFYNVNNDNYKNNPLLILNHDENIQHYQIIYDYAKYSIACISINNFCNINNIKQEIPDIKKRKY